MSRRWLAPLVGIVVTTLAVGTMSSLGLLVFIDLSVSAAAAALPCDQLPGTAEPFEGNQHIPYDGAPHQPYRTTPPTSGPHSPRIIAPGVYGEPIPEELQVHALEHGHILVQYAPGTAAADVEGLERLGRRYLRDVIVAPYPPLGHGIALTAWQRLQRLDGYDESALVRFVTTVAGRYDHTWQHGATDCLSG